MDIWERVIGKSKDPVGAFLDSDPRDLKKAIKKKKMELRSLKKEIKSDKDRLQDLLEKGAEADSLDRQLMEGEWKSLKLKVKHDVQQFSTEVKLLGIAQVAHRVHSARQRSKSDLQEVLKETAKVEGLGEIKPILDEIMARNWLDREEMEELMTGLEPEVGVGSESGEPSEFVKHAEELRELKEAGRTAEAEEKKEAATDVTAETEEAAGLGEGIDELEI